jgi:hypothetical protein
VTVAVGDGVGVRTPATAVPMAQSSTSTPSASCATAQTSADQTPGSETVVVTDNVVLGPTGRVSASTQPA